MLSGDSTKPLGQNLNRCVYVKFSLYYQASVYKELPDFASARLCDGRGCVPPLLETKSQCVKAPGLFSGLVLFAQVAEAGALGVQG